eukprot:scaffold13.g212.t1
MTTQPQPKPKATGIKVLRSFAAAAAPAEPQLAGLSLNGKPVAGKKAAVAPQETAEEAWAKALAGAGGDVAAAAAGLKQRLEGGDQAAGRAAAGLAHALPYGQGAAALAKAGLLEQLAFGVGSEDALPLDRQAALAAFAALAADGGRALEPHLLQLLPAVLDRCADRASSVREAAATAGGALVAALNPHAARVAVGHLLAAMASGRRWQSQAAALGLFAALARRAQVQVSHTLLEIVPRVSELMVDPRVEVAAAAADALLAGCQTVGNRDLERHIPALVSCIARPAEVPDVIGKLSATTFVQARGAALGAGGGGAFARRRGQCRMRGGSPAHELPPRSRRSGWQLCCRWSGPAPGARALPPQPRPPRCREQTVEDGMLAVMVPLLVRALRERSTTVKRRASVIIENMCKLVKDPADAHPFLPLLIPGLAKVAEEASDPELREVAGRAHALLLEIEKADVAEQADLATHPTDAPALLAALRAAAAAAAPDANLWGAFPAAALQHVAHLGASLAACKVHGTRTWESCTLVYLEPHLGGHAPAMAAGHALHRWALAQMGAGEEEEDEEDAENELCNCEFSLAYGGKILLQDTRLRLKRGRRYGLCGANGAGKSKGQLDGFPPKDVLRTVYVAHDLDASESQVSSVDYIHSDPEVQEATAPERPAVAAMLASVGFTPGLLDAPVGSLSGGWKMKLALARAMLMKADILLLDEPTNHLDTTNVAWLEQYLTSKVDISSMIVSHDSGFLDTVCTDIIHYESRKLGNLSEFVKVKPEAKTYYELSAATTRFKFPEPGFLDGIKGKSQSIVKLSGAAYAYPGAAAPQLVDVSVRCGLGARVAVLGANGAGKSTLIKMLTGETEPTEGTVWRHPNLRIAYVAQHAFHHVEQHLSSTPYDYIWWRYGAGEDREAAAKVTRKMTEAELDERERAIAAGKRVVDYLNSRRKAGKDFEYEVVWVGQANHPRNNSWMSRAQLDGIGLAKLCNDLDARWVWEGRARGEWEGGGAGCEVKLVLAGAMWSQPHLLVLDEPTNYLDRESLGALATAIQEFGGGVIMISHNTEFWSALCTEHWLVESHRVAVTKAGGGGGGLAAVPSQMSLASLATVSSVASLSSMATGAESAGGEEEDGELDEEALAEKQRKREEKLRKAADKAAKMAAKKQLKFSKRH